MICARAAAFTGLPFAVRAPLAPAFATSNHQPTSNLTFSLTVILSPAPPQVMQAMQVMVILAYIFLPLSLPSLLPLAFFYRRLGVSPA
jgi:hypothetical protein